MGSGSVVSWRDFYPRPPRGGRLPVLALFGCDILISIHALREEGDFGAPPVRRRS